MSRNRNRSETGALPLLEEAVHLLRQAELSALCVYWAGTIPFCLGLLWFWARLTRHWIPPETVAWAALGLAALYVAMKTAQADFCARLLAQRLQVARAARGWRGWLRLAASQARAQPWALGAFWAGAATLVPFPWALAYGQNRSVLGEAEEGGREAAEQTGADPRQNLIGVLFLLVIFAVVWLNAFSACVFLPWLANRLLGLDNLFSRGGLSFFNSTFLAASLALAWVAFDPLLKAFYTLRVFYGRALRTGEDLRVDLRLLRSALRVLPLLALLAAGPLRAGAAEPPPELAAESARLDRAIERTLAQPEFAWRLRSAPEESAEAPSGPIARFFSAAFDLGKRAWAGTRELFEKIHRWIFGEEPATAAPDSRHAPASLVVTYVLPIAAAAAIVGLAILVGLQVKASRVSAAAMTAKTVAAEPPDLAAEGIDAARLPAVGWLGLARDQARRGEWRLALRATYLATLAELAAREFILLALAKTNLDYERELRRRAASRTDVVARFALRRAQFESVWYGSSPAREVDVLAWIAEFDEKGAI